MRSAVDDARTTNRDDVTQVAPSRPEESGPRDLWLAHQLKNPLCAVKALVQLGLRNPAESASHERFALLEREIERVQEIVGRHLAAMHRSEPTPHRPTPRVPGGPAGARPQPFER